VGCGLQPKRRVAMQWPNTSDASFFHGAGVGQKKGKLDTKNSGYTLWLFNIAMENGPFIDGLPGFTY